MGRWHKSALIISFGLLLAATGKASELTDDELCLSFSDAIIGYLSSAEVADGKSMEIAGFSRPIDEVGTITDQISKRDTLSPSLKHAAKTIWSVAKDMPAQKVVAFPGESEIKSARLLIEACDRMSDAERRSSPLAGMLRELLARCAREIRVLQKMAGNSPEPRILAPLKQIDETCPTLIKLDDGASLLGRTDLSLRDIFNDLSSNDSAFRWRAILRTAMLDAQFQQEHLVWLLQRLANESKWYVRVRAENTILIASRRIGVRQALPVLISFSMEGQLAEWHVTRIVCTGLGDSAVESVVAYLSNEKPDVRRIAADILGRMGSVAQPFINKLRQRIEVETDILARDRMVVALRRIEKGADH